MFDGLLGHVLVEPCAFRAQKAMRSWIAAVNEREVVCLSTLQNHSCCGRSIIWTNHVLLDVTFDHFQSVSLAVKISNTV